MDTNTGSQTARRKLVPVALVPGNHPKPNPLLPISRPQKPKPKPKPRGVPIRGHDYFTELPIELLLMIARHCDIVNGLKLRLLFRSAEDDKVLELLKRCSDARLYIAPNISSLANMQRICDHPVLSKIIQEVVLVAQVSEPTREGSPNCLARRIAFLEKWAKTATITDEYAQALAKAWLDERKKQDLIHRSKRLYGALVRKWERTEDLGSIEASLRKLSSLSSLEFSILNRSDPGLNKDTFFDRCDALARIESPFSVQKLVHDSLLGSLKSVDIDRFLDALGAQTPRLVSVQIGVHPLYNTHSAEIDLKGLSSKFWTTPKIWCENLTNLTVGAVYQSAATLQSSEEWKALPLVFPALESLTICEGSQAFRNVRPEFTLAEQLLRFFDLKRLRALRLWGRYPGRHSARGRLRRSVLVDFIARHRAIDSFKLVHLKNIVLWNGPEDLEAALHDLHPYGNRIGVKMEVSGCNYAGWGGEPVCKTRPNFMGLTCAQYDARLAEIASKYEVAYKDGVWDFGEYISRG